MALTPKQRQDAITSLTVNCSCWKHEGDREILNGLSDDKIEHLIENLEETTRNSEVVELVTNGVFDEEQGFGFRIDPETGNPQMTVLNKEVCYDDEEEEEEVPTPKKKMTGNKGKDMTPQQVFNMLPPDMKKHYQKLAANEKRRKEALITKLTANIEDDDEREYVSNGLIAMDVEVLEKIVANQPSYTFTSDSDDIPNYSGVGSFTHNLQREKDLENDVMELPTTNGHYNTGIEDRKVTRRRDTHQDEDTDE